MEWRDGCDLRSDNVDRRILDAVQGMVDVCERMSRVVCSIPSSVAHKTIVGTCMEWLNLWFKRLDAWRCTTKKLANSTAQGGVRDALHKIWKLGWIKSGTGEMRECMIPMGRVVTVIIIVPIMICQLSRREGFVDETTPSEMWWSTTV